VSKRRKQLGWSVPGDDAEAFKRAVLVKWGKLRGVLGDELAKAMGNYINNHLSHAHTQKIAQIPAPHSTMFKRAALIFDRVKQAITPEQTSPFTEKEFNRAIKIVAKVADPRTLKNYRDLLKDLGWVKQDVVTLKYRIVHGLTNSHRRKRENE